jgi:hypothetical protein
MASSSTDIILDNNIKGNTYSQQQSPSTKDNILDKVKQEGQQADTNIWADYWYYKMGVNIIPADTKNKTTYESWSKWQNNSIPEELYSEWKNTNKFSNGMALIPGRVWRGSSKDKFLVFIDLDNQKAIDDVCDIFSCENLEYLSKYIIVEQHRDNRSKAHLYFYSNHEFKKKSSDAINFKDKIERNEIPGIEVKGLGEHGIAFCSPSVHEKGQRYEIIGTKEPQTCGKQVEDVLFQIYKKYDLSVDNNNGKIPIEKLFEVDTKIYEGHNRHEALLRVMESLIQRNKSILKPEQIKNLCYDWNQKHCQPPLDEKEFEKQWKDALNFIKKNHSSPCAIASTSSLITKKINDSPPIYYYADLNTKRIGRYKIKKVTNTDMGKIEEKKIPTNIIVDAIPKKIYLYESNPLLKSSPDRIKIVFESSICKDFEVGPYVDVEMIVKDLENKHLVLNSKNKTEALSCIINAYKEKNLVEVLDGITTEGYYLLDGKIKVVGSVQSITSDLDVEKGKKCAEFLDHLANNGWKNKNIFPTVLKWGIIAPFIFSVKYDSDKWIPWLLLYGRGQSGKTTLGKIVMHIWNLDERERSKGFTNIDSIPRFGHVISKDTYPIVMNEVGSLSTNNFLKYTPIIEAIKHSIENRVCRGKHIDKRYQEILALNPLILTSNHAPPNDGSFNRRLTSIHFPEEEKKDAEEQATFNKLLENNKRYLSVLGDFAASYILDNPSKLLDSNWNDLAEEILCHFYELVGAPKPDWIEYFEEQRDAIDESSEKTHFDLRAFLLNSINDVYARNKRFDHSDIEPSICSKLDYCLGKGLISFLSESKDHTIIITHDIMTRLRERNGIENLTSLKDVGSQIGFNSTSKYIDGKKMRVLEGKRDVLNNFIDPDMN